MENVQAYLTEQLSNATSPAILVSFGKDSLLLLHLARKVRPDTTIYYFNDDLSPFAQRVIIENNLTVLRYAPADRYIVPNGDGIALVDEYAINDTLLPVISPIVTGDSCKHSLPTRRTSTFRFNHDLALWGYKQSDHMEAVGTTFEKENMVGEVRFIAPLYGLTDADVYNALDELKIPYQNERNEIEWCQGCIDLVVQDWDREASLTAFRSRFHQGEDLMTSDSERDNSYAPVMGGSQTLEDAGCPMQLAQLIAT